jgi:DNA-binding response OmpR family regulator
LATVLVVDDTALARESVAKLLEYEGFDTIRAANGRDGWATLYDRKPDLILLDLMMPMMDGVTFLRLLRRSPLWKDVPVIVLTGVTDENRMVKEARDLGISDLVPKASFGFDDLLSRVKKVVPIAAEAGA